MAALVMSAAAFAQSASKQLTQWSTHLETTEHPDTYKVVFTGKIEDGYHTYTLTDEFSATEFIELEASGCELDHRILEL